MEFFKIISFLVLIDIIQTDTESGPEIEFSEFLGGSNNGLENISPIGVLKDIYSKAAQNPSLITFLHLSFSELWHNTQLWASLNDSNSYLVQPRSDGLSLEITSAVKNAKTIQNAPNIKSFISERDTLLNSLFSQGDFQYLKAPDRITKNSPKENLFNLIDKDKIISSFRISTLNDIFTEAIAMLTLAANDPFEKFSSDKIIWERKYWQFLTIAYGNKRAFLSRDKQMLVSLRFIIFNLVETRLHRVEAKLYRDILDSKFISLTEELQRIFDHQNIISRAQTHIINKLEPNIPANSGFSPEEEFTCEPCPDNIGLENVMESKFNNFEQSIQKILEKLEIINNPYRNIFSDTTRVRESLTKIKDDLKQFSKTFNFLTKINHLMEQVTNKFEEYKLIYILYATLIGVLLLVLIKILKFSLYILSCFKGCCEFSRDLSEFLKQRREARNQEQNYQEAPLVYPLVNYQRR